MPSTSPAVEEETPASLCRVEPARGMSATAVRGVGARRGFTTTEVPPRLPVGAARAQGRRWADPVGDAVAELLHQVSEIRRACRVVDRWGYAVLGVEQKAAGFDCLTSAQPCEKEVSRDWQRPPARNRFCRSCFLKWGSWKLKHQSGDPAADRPPRFEAEIRQGLGLPKAEKSA